MASTAANPHPAAHKPAIGDEADTSVLLVLLDHEVGFPPSSYDRVTDENASAATRTALGDEAFEQAWREGRAMTLEDAVKYALSAEDAPDSH